MNILPRLYFAAAQLIDTSDVDLPNKRSGAGSFLSTTFQSVLSLVFATMGGIAVLVITIAALQYVLSAGDPQKTAKSKDTIIYAFVGLAVAILGYAIFRFGLRAIIGS